MEEHPHKYERGDDCQSSLRSDGKAVKFDVHFGVAQGRVLLRGPAPAKGKGVLHACPRPVPVQVPYGSQRLATDGSGCAQMRTDTDRSKWFVARYLSPAKAGEPKEPTWPRRSTLKVVIEGLTPSPENDELERPGCGGLKKTSPLPSPPSTPNPGGNGAERCRLR